MKDRLLCFIESIGKTDHTFQPDFRNYRYILCNAHAAAGIAFAEITL